MSLCRSLFASACIALSGASAGAQSLTPEEVAALVDQRLNELNPYQSLLADPDPDRSFAAMQIMLESGDPVLMRMAIEFGLLSPNSAVRREAVEALLSSGPILTVVIDASGSEDLRNFGWNINRLAGTSDAENKGYIRLAVGEKSEEAECFLWRETSTCLFTVNADGVFLNVENSGTRFVVSRLTSDDAGNLVGSATLYNTKGSFPASIRLID
ncbi:MAG: hypothetical protein AAF618_02655 [Pseudomonadota bacterium]